MLQGPPPDAQKLEKPRSKKNIFAVVLVQEDEKWDAEIFVGPIEWGEYDLNVAEREITMGHHFLVGYLWSHIKWSMSRARVKIFFVLGILNAYFCLVKSPKIKWTEI